METIISKDYQAHTITISFDSAENYILKIGEHFVRLQPQHFSSEFSKLFEKLGLTSKNYTEYLCEWIKSVDLKLSSVDGKTSPEYEYIDECRKKDY